MRNALADFLLWLSELVRPAAGPKPPPPKAGPTPTGPR